MQPILEALAYLLFACNPHGFGDDDDEEYRPAPAPVIVREEPKPLPADHLMREFAMLEPS